MIRTAALLIILLFTLSADARTALTGPMTLTVDSDPSVGADTPSCGNAPTPCRTLQYTWNRLANDFDLQLQPVTIQAVCGNAAAPKFYDGLLASGRLVGQGGTLPPLVVNPGRPPYLIGDYKPVKVRGNSADMLGCFIHPAQDSGKPGLSLSDGASVDFEGFTIDTFRAKSDGIDVFTGAFLAFRNIRFGAAGPWSNHFSVASAFVLQDGNYTISGGGEWHINIGAAATWLVNNNGDPALRYFVTIIGAPAFNGGFVIVDHGIMYAIALSYVPDLANNGINQMFCLTAWVLRNGVIETANNGNPNVFPGNRGPILTSGGQYL